MLNELIKLSDRLDRKGLSAESDLLDNVIQKLAGNLIEFSDFKKTKDESPGDQYIIVLSDKETWDGEGYIAKVSPEELSLLDGPGDEKVRNVVSNKNMENIWNLIPEDLKRNRFDRKKK